MIAIGAHAASQAAFAMSPCLLATLAGNSLRAPSETAPPASVNADVVALYRTQRRAAPLLGAEARIAQPERACVRTSRAFCPRIFSR